MLKILIITLLNLPFSMPISFNQEVVVNVVGLKNTDGKCIACLYSDANAFPDETSRAIACKTVDIRDNAANITFGNVSSGTFAVSVFHDEDDDGEFDTNFLGIPQEGYGASGNVLPKMSEPKFGDNSFTVDQSDIQLEIKIKY